MKRITIKFQDQVLDENYGPEDLIDAWFRSLSMSKYPQGYVVIETDLKPEIEARRISEENKVKAKERIKTFDKTKLTTIAACKEAIADIVEMLR